MKRDLSSIIDKKISFASKRAHILNECKKSKNAYCGKSLTVQPTEDPEEEFPTDVKRFDQVDFDVAIVKKKNGERIPRIINKGDTKNKTLSCWLPPMEVKYSDLGPNGNLGRYKYTKDPQKARFTCSLLASAPPELNHLKEKFEADGEKALEFVESLCNKAMGIAYNDEDTWKNVKKDYEDVQSFIESAKHSVIKRDGDDILYLNLTRRLEGFRGEPNRPTLWRLKEDNSYETIDPKFIPKGSMLAVQIKFRAFKTPDGGYGMSGDIGDHILVVHKPAKKEEKSTLFDVPYIPFD